MEDILLKILVATSILLIGLGVRYLVLKDKSKFSKVLKEYYYLTYIAGITVIIVLFLIVKWLSS